MHLRRVESRGASLGLGLGSRLGARNYWLNNDAFGVDVIGVVDHGGRGGVLIDVGSGSTHGSGVGAV